jgi:hypothetical protein
MNYKTTLATIALASLVFVGCRTPKAPDFKPLNASFTDTKWDGSTVPKDEVCKKFAGTPGNTPSIKITNLNPTTQKIILSFNDESARPVFNNGGHGVLQYKGFEKGASTIIIPSAPGQVKELPEGFSIQRDFTREAWDSGSGYLPPCSGGRGNIYSVDIRALNDKEELTGETKLRLGRY